jgi:hypothetical protein
MAYFFVGEYAMSLQDLHHAESYLPSDDEAEKEKIVFCIGRAEKGLREQEKALLKRKQAMQKAFNSTPAPSTANPSSEGKDKSRAVTDQGWTRQRILLAVSMVFIVLLAIYASTLQRT